MKSIIASHKMLARVHESNPPLTAEQFIKLFKVDTFF